MMNKIVFLDIDGVMNTENHPVLSDYHIDLEFSPLAVKTLETIIQKSGASIVISSTWRYGRTIKELQQIFSHYSHIISSAIVGTTGQMKSRRSLEIQTYIDTYLTNSNESLKIAILDDDDFDMDHLRPILVKIDRVLGLRPEYTEIILRLLD